MRQAFSRFAQLLVTLLRLCIAIQKKNLGFTTCSTYLCTIIYPYNFVYCGSYKYFKNRILFIYLCMYFCFQVTQWTRLQHICKHAEDWFPWISEFDNWNGFAYRYESTFFSIKSHQNNGSTKQQWIKVRILNIKIGSLVKSLFFKLP